MIADAQHVAEPGYGFYYLLCGLLGSGFLVLVVGIFIYFWKNQVQTGGQLQQISVDQALMKRDVEEIKKDVAECTTMIKENNRLPPPAVTQQTLINLFEKIELLVRKS